MADWAGRSAGETSREEGWSRHNVHRQRRPAAAETEGRSVGLGSELFGIGAIWANALFGTLAICALGAPCVPLLVLGGCVYACCCFCRRRAQHQYAPLAQTDVDVEARADWLMGRACVRELRDSPRLRVGL